MLNHGEASAHLVRTGRGATAKKPAPVPASWTGDVYAWNLCMKEQGYTECECDGKTARWIALDAATADTFGWCAIVGLDEKTGRFALHLTISTLENEDDSPWIYPSARYATPLEAAKAALRMFEGLKP